MRQSQVWCCAAGLLLCAGAADRVSAQFVKLVIREDKTLPPAPNLPADLRTFNMYAQFAGPGTYTGPGRINSMNQIAQPDRALGFGINLQQNPGANFFQAPTSVGATSNTVGAPDVSYQAGGGNDAGVNAPRAYYDTFLSFGVKQQNSDPNDPNGNPYFVDTSVPNGFFEVKNTDSVHGASSLGLGAGHDFILGGWLHYGPQGAATQDANGEYTTFLGQFSISGLKAGANVGYWTGQTQPDSSNQPGAVAFTFYSEIFTGRMTLYDLTTTPKNEIPININFVPAPGPAVSLGLVGMSFSRRRRR